MVRRVGKNVLKMSECFFYSKPIFGKVKGLFKIKYWFWFFQKSSKANPCLAPFTFRQKLHNTHCFHNSVKIYPFISKLLQLWQQHSKHSTKNPKSKPILSHVTFVIVKIDQEKRYIKNTFEAIFPFQLQSQTWYDHSTRHESIEWSAETFKAGRSIIIIYHFR